MRQSSVIYLRTWFYLLDFESKILFNLDASYSTSFEYFIPDIFHLSYSRLFRLCVFTTDPESVKIQHYAVQGMTSGLVTLIPWHTRSRHRDFLSVA